MIHTRRTCTHSQRKERSVRAPFTVVSMGQTSEVEVMIDGQTVRATPEVVSDALGWELKSGGLCRGDTCIPVRDPRTLVGANGVDLAAVVDALGQPLALDIDERVAVIGAAATDRDAELANLVAPDFSLPDLEGREHSLTDYRGRKVLLIAYASW
jgi:hypothetical protein